MSENHRTTRSPDAAEQDATASERRPAAVGTLTVADVLALPVLASGQPRVLTGEDRLDRPVRWVHITELTDPASFLKGGELVLTTGMPLPEDPTGVRRYVDELADIGTAALVIELVRRYHRPPDALVHACRTRGLPLIALTKDVNFLEVTQVVHALLLGSQADAMRRTQRIHEAFTALTLRGAGPEDVVRAAAEMSGHTVVLENLVHQALVCEPSGSTVEEALTGWEQRSRATPPAEHTDVRGPESWLVAPVEYQGERWGRVAMLPASSGPSSSAHGASAAARALAPEDVTVLERTAMALTIARLIHSTPGNGPHTEAPCGTWPSSATAPRRTPAPAPPPWACRPRSTTSSPYSWTCATPATPASFATSSRKTTPRSRRPSCPRNSARQDPLRSSANWPPAASASCWRCAPPSPGGPRSNG